MSLRSALSDLVKVMPNEVLKIGQEVSVEYEITAYAEALSASSPVLVFERVKGYAGFTVISNMFSSRSKIAAFLGVSETGLNEKWVSILNRDSDFSVRSSGGPVREIVMLGDTVDVMALPAPLHYAQDGGRYITGGITVAKDNDGKVNLSFARIQLIDKTTIAMSMHSRGHLWSYYLHAREKKQDLPISIVIGAHPIYYLMAAARIDEEYRKVQGLIDDYLITGLTNDLPVPANAEIVIEGKILWDKTYNEGPFTEYTGYLSNRSTKNVAKIDAIYMRKDAMYLEINPSSSKEHILLSGIAKEPVIMSTISNFLPSAYRFSVEWPLKGVHYVAMAYIENPDRGISKQLGLMMVGLDHYLKIVFVSENRTDLKLYNMISQMLCSVKTDIIKDVFCNRLDPSASPDGTSSKVIFICRGNQEMPTIEASDSGVNIGRCGKKLHIGHSVDESAQINLLVDNDINPRDEEEVLWAMATKLQPAEGIRTSETGMIIDARRSGLSRPKIPEEAIKAVTRYLQTVPTRS
ncbi:MAG: UbiD family decarboxylase [Conexivisphaerales archaeon]